MKFEWNNGKSNRKINVWKMILLREMPCLKLKSKEKLMLLHAFKGHGEEG